MIHRSTSGTTKHYVLERHEEIMGVPRTPGTPQVYATGRRLEIISFIAECGTFRALKYIIHAYKTYSTQKKTLTDRRERSWRGKWKLFNWRLF